MSLLGGADNIGLRLTGDPSGLQRALVDGGKSVEAFARKGERDLKRVEGDFKRTGTAADNLKDTLVGFAAGGTVLGGFALGAKLVGDFSREMLQAQVQADKLRNTLNFAVGRESAGAEMVFLREKSRELGLEFISTSQQYARLAAAARGTNLEGHQTREVFDAIAKASVVLGMSADETEGALRAVQQMMSKGRVQAEELRGQLGERLPGAFFIAARAMGVTEAQLNKLLETGSVAADDFLPKFARQLKTELGDAWIGSAQSAQSGMNRYENSWTNLKQSLAQSGMSDFVSGQMAVLADGLDSVSERMDAARANGGGFVMQMVAAGGAVVQFLNPINAFNYTAQSTAERLKAAEDRLVELKEAAALPSNWGNSFLPSAIKDTEALIIRLREARAEQARLAGANTDPRAAYLQFPSRSQAVVDYSRRQAADRDALAKMRQSLSGQHESYQRNLAELARLRENGTIQSDDEYRGLVKNLIEQQGGIKKGQKRANPADGVFRSVSERAAELRQEIALEEDLTAAQKLAAKVLDDLRTGSLKLTDAEKARMGLALQDLLTTDKANGERERAIKLHAENAKIIERNNEAATRDAETRLRVLDGHIETNEQLRQEIRLIGVDEKTRTQLLQTIEQEEIARLQLDLVMAQNIEGNDAQVAAIEREIAVRKQRIGLLGDKGVREEHARILEDQKRAAMDVAEALTDNLMQGGKSFWEYMKDTARTTVLRPIILAGVTSGMSALGFNMSGFTGSAAGGGGGGLDLFNTGGIAGLGGTFGAGVSAGTGGLSGMFGANAAGTTFMGTLDAGFTALGAGNVAGGLGTLAGALGPLALIGLPLLGGMFKKKGGPKVEGFAGSNGLDSRPWSGGLDAGLNSSLAPFVQSTQAQFDAAMRAFSGTASAQFGLGASTDPKGTAGTMLFKQATVNGRSILETVDRGVGRSEEELQAALNAASGELLLNALRAADLPGTLGNLLRQDMSVGADRISKIVTERTTLQARLTDLTSSALEKLNAQREAERAAIDSTNRALLDQVHAEEDLVTLKGALAEAGSRERESLEQAISAHRSYAQELREFRNQLVLGDSSPYAPGTRTAEARRQFQAILADTQEGDLRSASGTYLSALSGSAGSRAEYAVGFAQVTAALAMAAASEDSKATVEQQQLDVLKGQLSALDMLNDNVQTFAEALSAYNQGLARAVSARAASSAADASYIAAAPAAAAGPAPLVEGSPEWWRARFGSGFDMSSPGYYGSAFASGGMHFGGLRLVGEDGPELEVTGPSRIFNARQTQEILRGANGGGDSALLRELLQELRAARQDKRGTDMSKLASLQNIDAWLKKLDTVGPEATWPVRTAA